MTTSDEQRIIEVLVQQLMYWATPGRFQVESEDWWQARKSQDIVTLVCANKEVYPYTTD